MKTFKNILIVALIALCVYQLAGFWYGDGFSGSVFALNLNLSGKKTAYDYASLVKPGRIIIGDGSKDGFAIIYNNIDGSSVKEKFDGAIKSALGNGVFVSSGAIDYGAFIGRASVMYEYMFPMPTDDFCKAFSKSSAPYAPRFGYFNAVAVIPDADGFSIYFLNYDTGNEYEYSVAYDKTSDLMSAALAVRDLSAIKYEMAEAEDSNLEPGMLSAVIGAGTGISYYPETISYPYLLNGESLLSNIAGKASFFFKNPASVTPDSSNGVYTFRENKTYVTYQQNNVITYAVYSDYGTGGKSAASFMPAYSAAAAFLKRDTTLANEYYMSGYEYDDINGVWDFYFDPAVNNLPAAFPESAAQDTKMSHFIEFKVAGGTVTEYKRLACDFLSGGAAELKALKSLYAAFNIANGGISGDETILSADLRYSADYNDISASKESAVTLSWFFVTEYGVTDSETGGAVMKTAQTSYPAE